MKTYPVTVNGFNDLKNELNHLKSVERPAIIRAIQEARSHGDLSENAEYSSAKEKQSFIEGRIKELEIKLSLAEVVDTSKLINEGKVVFGSTIKLLDLESDAKVSYQIVGEDEANIKDGKISLNSPIAKFLIGKSVDMEVEIVVPSGTKYFKIIECYF